MELLLADLIAGVHLGIVLYVLVGQLLILAGWALRWAWVRGFWFRLSHLLLVLWVAVQAGLGEICPLTTWEFELRRRGGQEGQEGTFVDRLMHDLLFVDVPQTTLDKVYIGFALVVVVTLVCCRPRPPRRRLRSRSSPPPPPGSSPPAEAKPPEPR